MRARLRSYCAQGLTTQRALVIVLSGVAIQRGVSSCSNNDRKYRQCAPCASTPTRCYGCIRTWPPPSPVPAPHLREPGHDGKRAVRRSRLDSLPLLRTALPGHQHGSFRAPSRRRSLHRLRGMAPQSQPAHHPQAAPDLAAVRSDSRLANPQFDSHEREKRASAAARLMAGSRPYRSAATTAQLARRSLSAD
jgi:hypothetical protein